MKKSTWLFAVLTLALGIWLWQHFAGGAEGKIRRQLARLEALIEKEKGEGALTAVGKAQELEQLFARSFAIEIQPLNARVSDLRELQRLYVATRQAPETIAATFTEIEITVDGPRAAARLVAHFNGLAGALGARESMAATFEFREEDRAWKIARVQVFDLADVR